VATNQEQFNKINIADFYPVDDNEYADIRKASVKEKKPSLDDKTPSSLSVQPVKMTQAEVKEHHKKEEKNLQNEIEMMMM
jgi:hypothetical protein